MEQQARLYVEMSRALRSTRVGDDFEAGREFRLLEEAKDILDELRIMRDINFNQQTLLKTLSRISAFHVSEKRKEYFLRDRPKERRDTMEETMLKAGSAYEAILHLIDLKQKQGNLFQATAIRDLLKSNHALTSSSQKILDSTNETLQQSEKSGETLMVVSPSLHLS